jgi:hypothetical protein
MIVPRCFLSLFAILFLSHNTYSISLRENIEYIGVIRPYSSLECFQGAVVFADSATVSVTLASRWSSKPAFSGTITMQGKRHPFRGVFRLNSSGIWETCISGIKGLPNLYLTLNSSNELIAEVEGQSGRSYSATLTRAVTHDPQWKLDTTAAAAFAVIGFDETSGLPDFENDYLTQESGILSNIVSLEEQLKNSKESEKATTELKTELITELNQDPVARGLPRLSERHLVLSTIAVVKLRESAVDVITDTFIREVLAFEAAEGWTPGDMDTEAAMANLVESARSFANGKVDSYFGFNQNQATAELEYLYNARGPMNLDQFSEATRFEFRFTPSASEKPRLVSLWQSLERQLRAIRNLANQRESIRSQWTKLLISSSPSTQRLVEAAVSNRVINDPANPDRDYFNQYYYDPSSLRSESEILTQQITEAKQRLDYLQEKTRRFRRFRDRALASKSLLRFKGYGTMTTVMQSRSGTAITALTVGTAPDGQKFTSSGKLLRQASFEGRPQSGFGLIIASTAGAREVSMRLEYEISQEKALTPRDYTNDGRWEGIALALKVGTLVVPDRTLKNIFRKTDVSLLDVTIGGNIDPSGPSSPYASDGGSRFQARLNANNTTELISARPGDKLTVSNSPYATFAGSIIDNSSLASAISGIFLRSLGHAPPDSPDYDPSSDYELFGFGQIQRGAESTSPILIVGSPYADYNAEYSSQDWGLGDDELAPIPENVLTLRTNWTNLASTLTLKFGENQISRSVLCELLRDGVVVASSYLDLDGTAVFNTNRLTPGQAQYSVRMRDTRLDRQKTGNPSGEFTISSRTMPQSSFQILLGPDSERTRNGQSFQGRVTCTSTSSGKWSGKLEWFSLTQARNQRGVISDYLSEGESVWIPEKIEYPLVGQLVPSPTADDPNRLASVISIPLSGIKGVHQLTLEVSDAQSSEFAANKRFDSSWPAPPAPTAAKATVSLELDPSFEESQSFWGSGLVAVTAVPAAQGKYRTITVRNNDFINNHLHTFDYTGKSTVSYFFQTGPKSIASSSSLIGSDGNLAVFASASLAKEKLAYINENGSKSSAEMERFIALANYAQLSANPAQSGRYQIEETSWDFAGYFLELSKGTRGGHILRDEWAYDESASLLTGGRWRLDESAGVALAKLHRDFNPSEKITANTPYLFEIILNECDLNWSGTVSFDPSGKGLFIDPMAGALGITVSANASGEIKATVKMSGSSPSNAGTLRPLTGFTTPGGLLFGWGSVEGGGVGFRIFRK